MKTNVDIFKDYHAGGVGFDFSMSLRTVEIIFYN